MTEFRVLRNDHRFVTVDLRLTKRSVVPGERIVSDGTTDVGVIKRHPDGGWTVGWWVDGPDASWVEWEADDGDGGWVSQPVALRALAQQVVNRAQQAEASR